MLGSIVVQVPELAPTDARPEGMLLSEHAGRSLVAAGDDGPPGAITFSELVDRP